MFPLSWESPDRMTLCENDKCIMRGCCARFGKDEDGGYIGMIFDGGKNCDAFVQADIDYQSAGIPFPSK